MAVKYFAVVEDMREKEMRREGYRRRR
jgi:hypothetical protein